MFRNSLKWIVPAAVLVLIPFALLWTPVRAALFSAGVSPETKGVAVADANGCFECHGQGGGGGVANPGAGKIPGLTNFAFTMSVHSEKDLHEWILDGAPERERSKPEYEPGRKNRAVVMPAYRKQLKDHEFAQLLAWYHAVSGIVYPREPKALAGYKVADAKGCFSCHGLGGRFDVPNRGSLVGRIPAWHGKDFAELARDETEIRAWILDGITPRHAKNPIARHFLSRQVLQMPQYRGKLSDQEIDAILDYIRWLRDPKAEGQEPKYQAEDEPEYDPYDYN